MQFVHYQNTRPVGLQNRLLTPMIGRSARPRPGLARAEQLPTVLDRLCARVL